MAKKSVLKPNRSFRENARLLVPALLEDFLSHRSRVVAHPRLKNDFHKMRLSGKTLRYAMEIFEDAFEEEFSACLKEVKQLLDVMGNVHDCDVNIPLLRRHLREIQSFNRVTSKPEDKIRTKALSDFIQGEQNKRMAMFNEACVIVERWVAEDFKQKIVQSMNAGKV